MAWLAVQARGGGGRGTPAAEAMESIAQRISMYIDPPQGEVTIEDFERFAVDRLRGDHRACSEEMLCCSVSLPSFQDAGPAGLSIEAAGVKCKVHLQNVHV